MAKLKKWGEYLTFGLLGVLLTTIGGIILTAWKTSLGLIVGASVIALAWFLSAYIYRYFDSRPDVVRAREELKQTVAELESMRKDYVNMKSKIDQAMAQINNVNYKMQQIGFQIDDASQKATAGFWMGVGHWAKDFLGIKKK